MILMSGLPGLVSVMALAKGIYSQPAIQAYLIKALTAKSIVLPIKAVWRGVLLKQVNSCLNLCFKKISIKLAL
jgi:hypothetical protein